MSRYNVSKKEAAEQGIERVKISGGSGKSESPISGYDIKLEQAGWNVAGLLGTGKFGKKFNKGEYERAISDPEYSQFKKPTAQEQIQLYLDSYGKAIEAERKALEAPIKSDTEIQKGIKDFVTPQTAKPEAPSFVDLFQELRSDNDVKLLETQLNDLKGQEDDLHAELREMRSGERGKLVSTSVIAGRISKGEQDLMERIDFVGRQKTRLANELQTRYSLINTIMDLTKTDYDIAYKSYQDEFNNNIKMYDMFRVEKKEAKEDWRYNLERATRGRERAEDKAFDWAKTIMEWEREDKHRQEDAARSNLQIYANLIQSGNMSYDDLDDNAKTEMARLEVRAGLGVGFISGIQRDNPNGEIKSITTREGSDGMKYSDIITQNPDGSLSVKSMKMGSYRLPKGSGGSGDYKESDAIGDIQTFLDKKKGDDQKTDPFDWNEAKSEWKKEGFKGTNYDRQFAEFVNKDRIDEYNLSLSQSQLLKEQKDGGKKDWLDEE